jgi:hypothetical protein
VEVVVAAEHNQLAVPQQVLAQLVQLDMEVLVEFRPDLVRARVGAVDTMAAAVGRAEPRVVQGVVDLGISEGQLWPEG